MPELLLELFSEEIPARMQEAAAKDLERLVVGALSDRGLMFEGVKAFSGPRRLTLSVLGLPAKQPDVSEEKKGPRVGAPEKAIEGFLRSASITLDQCEKRNDGKGEFYVAVIARKGRATAEVLAELLPETIGKLPWPKSMRWPQPDKPSGPMAFGGISFSSPTPVRWVRPLHSIVCTFEGEIVPFKFANVQSSNTTRGHRFLSHGHIEVRRYEDYEKKLRSGHVVLDAADRKDIIRHELKQQAFALGLELIEDEGLLNEVAGLAEWPVVLIGKIEDQFMDVPPEILQTSMRTHQKYFALRDPKTGKLANRFALVSNMKAGEGNEIVAGNERVLRARLSDAKFFWDQDRKRTLESRVEDLENITYYGGYSYADKVSSIETKAREIADAIGADAIKAGLASRLCKADLTTGVVGEFPELQGIMGSYYFLEHHRGETEIAAAIRDHYKPLGPNDSLPLPGVGAAVAIADKLATLCWLFLEGERPTGSKDPHGLRRAALGIVRIILENGYRFSLLSLFSIGGLGALSAGTEHRWRETEWAVTEFMIDRLKVLLREKRTRHDLIDAVFSLGNEDDLVRLVARVEALQSFLKTEDGTNLLAGYKRAVNIVKVEEKKDGCEYGIYPEMLPSAPNEERDLWTTLQSVHAKISPLINAEKFVEAMKLLAGLRAPVDAFFEKVRVNDDDKDVRANRLMLLSRLRAALHLVADFSKIEG